MSRPELALAAARPFARGSRRLVYRDPRNERRAVKLTVSSGRASATVAPGAGSLRREDFRGESERQWKEHCLLLRRLGLPWPRHLPACYGMDTTDVGVGLVVELVADADGSPAASLARHVGVHGLDARCRRALKDLRRFLVQRCVILRDVRPDNILLREDRDGTLVAVIVDGVDVAATTRILSFCRRRRVVRQWRSLLAQLRAGLKCRAAGGAV
jgi:hypothetical protein